MLTQASRKMIFSLISILTLHNIHSSAFAQATANEDAKPSTSTVSSSTGAVLDRIVASVGNEIILLSDIQKIVAVTTQGQTQLLPNGKLIGGTLSAEDAKRLFEQLIDQKVLALRVRELELTVGDDELEAEIASFLKKQNVSEEQFQELLKAEGETEESYREEFRRQLETQRFIGRMIRPLVTVTEDEVRSFYLQRSGGSELQKVKLRSLMLNMPAELPEASKQAKQKTIETIQKELEAGVDFVGLVKLYSESPDAVKTGGELQAKRSSDLPEPVREKLKGAKPGAVLGPFVIGSSVFFFQLIGMELDDAGDFEKQKPQVENQLLETKFQERLNDYIRAERSKVKIDRRSFNITR